MFSEAERARTAADWSLVITCAALGAFAFLILRGCVGVVPGNMSFSSFKEEVSDIFEPSTLPLADAGTATGAVIDRATSEEADELVDGTFGGDARLKRPPNTGSWKRLAIQLVDTAALGGVFLAARSRGSCGGICEVDGVSATEIGLLTTGLGLVITSGSEVTTTLTGGFG